MTLTMNGVHYRSPTMLRVPQPQELGVQIAVQRMVLQLQTSRMLFRPRVKSTISSVTASMLASAGVASLSSAVVAKHQHN